MEPVKLVTHTPIGNRLEITLKRWFQTREFWIGLASLVLIIAPIGGTFIGQLGLSPIAVMVWTMIIACLNFFAQQYLKNTSKSMVVSKQVLSDESASAMNDPAYDTGEPDKPHV